MPASVELPTLSASEPKLRWRTKAPTIVELAVPWRRRSRLRRILTELRRIRRSQPHLQFIYSREQHLVYIEFTQDSHWTVFQLLWPMDLPTWETTTDWPESA